jgi:hypothetical protein
MQATMKHGKALTISGLVVGTMVLVGLTIWGAIWVSHSESRKAEANFPQCTGTHTAHEVLIRNNQVIPKNTIADRCDTLTITNLDDQERIVAFGQHEHHEAYDGVTERYLSQGGRLTVTLIQPGNFRFHDHEDDSVQGTFTVKN